jgi:hypothetical protein
MCQRIQRYLRTRLHWSIRFVNQPKAKQIFRTSPILSLHFLHNSTLTHLQILSQSIAKRNSRY